MTEDQIRNAFLALATSLLHSRAATPDAVQTALCDVGDIADDDEQWQTITRSVDQARQAEAQMLQEQLAPKGKVSH